MSGTKSEFNNLTTVIKDLELQAGEQAILLVIAME